MRSTVLTSLVLATACTAAPSDPGATSTDGKGDSATATVAHDCVIDTLQVNDGVELGQALVAAVDPQFIKDFGPQYDLLVQVPSGMQSPIVTTDEFGSYIYSFHGWDIVPHDLVGDFPGTTGLFATINAPPVHGANHTFARRQRIVAKALFDALTRATETTTEHHVDQPAYDQSWTRVRRAAPHDRLTCDKTVYPDSGTTEPTYTCVINKLAFNNIQEFDAAQAGGFCPSPP